MCVCFHSSFAMLLEQVELYINKQCDLNNTWQEAKQEKDRLGGGLVFS